MMFRSAAALSVLCVLGAGQDRTAPLAQEAKQVMEWFDGLGFPDVRGCKYVRATTGNWTQTGNKPPETQYLWAFLLEDREDTFRIFTPDLFILTCRKTGPAVPEHERIGYEVADLEKTARRRLDQLLAPPGDDPDTWRRFGELLPERSELFVLARGCERNGLAVLARDLFAYVRGLPDSTTGKPPEKPFAQVLSDEFAHALMWRAILDFENPSISRKDLLETFRRILRLYPGSQETARAKETADLLEKMVDEDKVHSEQGGKQVQDMTRKEQIQELIFRLRDQNGRQWSQPGSCDIFADERKEGSPAHQLVKLGYDAVPALIEVVDDERFTRSVGYHRNFYFSHHVLRVGDCALAILGRIAGRSFYEFTYTNAAMVKDGAGGTTKTRIKAWWAEFEKKGEKRMLIEAVESGDAQQAARLAAKHPEAALAAIARGLSRAETGGGRAALIEVAAGLEGDAAVALLRAELKGSPFPRSRVAAARGLLSRGHSESVQAMIEKWKQSPDGAAEDMSEVVAFLVGVGRPEAVQALGHELGKRPLRERLAVASALGERRGNFSLGASGTEGTLDPAEGGRTFDRETLAAMEHLLIAALEDTSERVGLACTWDGKSFSDPRVCDIAGHVLQQRWGTKYAFDISAQLPVRDRRRTELMNVWRKEHNLPALAVSVPRRVSRLPESEVEPHLKQMVEGATEEVRLEASRALEKKGLGALPSVAELAARLGANHRAHPALRSLAVRLALIVNEVVIDPRSKPVDPVFRDAAVGLKGKSITPSDLVELLQKGQPLLNKEVGGLRLWVDREGDLGGVTLRLRLVEPQRDAHRGWWTVDGRITAGPEDLYSGAPSYNREFVTLQSCFGDFTKPAAKAFQSNPEAALSIRVSLLQTE